MFVTFVCVSLCVGVRRVCRRRGTFRLKPVVVVRPGRLD